MSLQTERWKLAIERKITEMNSKGEYGINACKDCVNSNLEWSRRHDEEMQRECNKNDGAIKRFELHLLIDLLIQYRQRIDDVFFNDKMITACYTMLEEKIKNL